MSSAGLLMLVVAIAALAGGVVVMLRPVRSDAGTYLKRMAGVMLIAFGLVLLIAAFSLNTAFTEATHA
jgi:uncharacterized membrane protein HdeD (DUF308 family)